MHRLRMWIAGALLWAFVLYNVERFHEPINLASFVYVLAAGAAVAVLLIRPASKLPPGLLVGCVLAVFVLTKTWRDLPLIGSALPLTITEICALSLSTLIAQRLAQFVYEFEEAAARVVLMEGGVEPATFEVARSELYREVRRARRQKRPLTVVALAPDKQTARAAAPRLVEEVQKNCAQKYLERRLAGLMARAVADEAWIVQHDDYFLVLFPEHDRNEALETIDKIERAASAELGVRLQRGLAAFPDEEITFSGLIERAERLMRGEDAPLPEHGWRSAPPPTDPARPNGNGRGGVV